MTTTSRPRCKKLVLDAGPLLSLMPLRGLAETFLTVPQVFDELKDKRAREHFERLGLSAGIRVEVKEADKGSLAQVIQCAKQTGDYAVLSYADLCVLALTYSLDLRDKEEVEKALEETSIENPAITEGFKDFPQDASNVTLALADKLSLADSAGHIQEGAEGLEDECLQQQASGSDDGEDDQHREPLNVELHRSDEELPSSSTTQTPGSQPSQSAPSSATQLYDDPSDSDDGEGEWITPSNVAIHKSRALDFLPTASAKGKDKEEIIDVGCMTADFAMQNVLLRMRLSLVSVDGKRIEKVKSWVLRCHACFKICKDNTKKFCPSCGNPTLLRASVTIGSNDASAMQVHLKPNFQYRTRGTIYSIPSPKPGSAKHGHGEGLILREDQAEYVRAKGLMDGKTKRDEKKMVKGMMGRGGIEGGVKTGNWMDPDWIPEIMSTGAGRKGRRNGGGSDMPVIGYGKKNPNERRRKT